MGKVVAVTNQKGGVGKTTTGINVSASLARSQRRVLLVDLDPQGNASAGSGVNKEDCHGKTVYEVLLEDAKLADVRIRCGAGYDVVPSDADLAGAQVELIDAKARERRLRNALAQVREEYDYIFIDCPPALNMLTVNALVAANTVMIPMQCEYFAMEGLSDLVNTIRKVRETLNPQLQIEGLLRTMYDPRNSLAKEVSAQLSAHFGDKVYQTIIPRNVRLAEAPSFGRPVIDYAASSRGAEAYLALAAEIMRRDQGTQAA